MVCVAAIVLLIVMMMKDENEMFAYDTNAYIAPPEYEAFGINNPVYSP